MNIVEQESHQFSSNINTSQSHFTKQLQNKVAIDSQHLIPQDLDLIKDKIKIVQIQLRQTCSQIQQSNSESPNQTQIFILKRQQLMKQLINLQFLHRKVMRMVRQKQIQQFKKQQMDNLQNLQKQIDLQEQKYLRNRQNQQAQYLFKKQSQQILRQRSQIYHPTVLIETGNCIGSCYSIIESEIANIRLGYKQPRKEYCPLYENKRYHAPYAYSYKYYTRN